MSEANRYDPTADSRQRHNHLATAEMGEEINYNQIDGIINNNKPSILEHLRNFRPQQTDNSDKPERIAERDK